MGDKAVKQASSICQLLSDQAKVLLVYSRLSTEKQKQIPFDDIRYEKQYTIVKNITSLVPHILSEQNIPLIGHSHGAVLALLARHNIETSLESKIPLILYGIGSWHLPSFVNALKLLSNSASPTIIYLRAENELIL